MNAARNLPVEASGKVGWQAERFWETRDQIYGGISWTTDTIRQVWYPSSGFLSRKGMLTGAYMYGKIAEAFNARPVEERLHIAREQGERLHEGFGKFVEHGIAIGWDRMEHFGFAWSDETDPAFGDNAETTRDAAGPLPSGRRPDHVLERLAGGRDHQRLGGGEVDRPADQSDGEAGMKRTDTQAGAGACNSPSRWSATTATSRSSTAP